MSCSAVIPVRNRSTLIVAAIASVQQQTVPLDDIVVVDDGSTDATREAVTALAQQDRRIRLVALSTRSGASAARNAGIAASRSEWVAFLDSDDQWLPRKHELQLRALAQAPGAVASFTGIRHLGADRVQDRYAPPQVTLQELRRLNYLGSTSTALVRRSALRAIDGFDATLPSCQDWDLWIKLRRLGDFAIVCEPLVVFNHTAQARISNNKAGVLAGHAQLLARTLAEIGDPRERRVIAAYHQLRLSEIYHWDFDAPRAAVLAAMKSLALHPTRHGARLLIKTLKAGSRALAGRLRGIERRRQTA